jgi:hypothetical protein
MILKMSEDKKGSKNPMFGKHHTEERKRQISEGMSGEKHFFYGKKHPASVLKKMSEGHKRMMTPEYLKKMSDVQKGKTLSEEHKEKLRKAATGRVFDEATRKKLSESMKARRLSPEHKQRIREALLGRAPKIKGDLKFSDSLGHEIRSSLEEKVLLELMKNKIKYEYEPEGFKITDDGHIYWPDARISGTDIYIECKGYFDARSKLKINGFIERNPDKKMVIVTYRRWENSGYVLELSKKAGVVYEDTLSDLLKEVSH